jgi:RNA polymerase sigma factor (sigma-70 family)
LCIGIAVPKAKAEFSMNDGTNANVKGTDNRLAFRQLVEQYQGLICGLALSACGDPTQSQDFAQETFAIAWQHIDQIRDAEKLKPWLRGILRNIIRDTRRKQGRSWRRGLLSLNDAEYLSSGGLTPPENAISKEEIAIIRQALAALPSKYREPLVLFYMEDQSIARVAAQLDLFEEVVRQRLSRGRRILKRQFLEIFERTLARTKPGHSFTATAMAAVSGGASAKGGAGLVAIKGASLGKAIVAIGPLSSCLSPLATLLLTPRIARRVACYHPLPDRRAYMTRFAWAIGIINTLSGSVIALLCVVPGFMMRHPVLFGLLLGSTVLLSVGLIVLLSVRARNYLKHMDDAHHTTG